MKLLRSSGKRKTAGSLLRTRFLNFLWLSLLAVFVGTIGYMEIEEWSLEDAFYMTVITMTTVGFGEVRPLSDAGRWFTIVLILGGVGIVTYFSSSVVHLLISGELQAEFVARRRRRMLTQLQNHYIVCGFGRVGRHVAAELQRQKKSFVIIDSSEAVVERCHHMGYNSLLGNAANDEILERAGIHRARSLITAVSSDAENVFIVLTARSLRSDLVIVARANFDETEPKLLRAGANHVIIPYAISGRRMVASADHPTVVDFLDVVMHSPELELWLEDVVIAPSSLLVGRSLREANLRSEIGVNVLSMQLPGQRPVLQPNIDVAMQAGTHLIVLGTRQQLEMLAELAGSAIVKA